MLSIADIPMAGIHFTGIIGVVLWQTQKKPGLFQRKKEFVHFSEIYRKPCRLREIFHDLTEKVTA